MLGACSMWSQYNPVKIMQLSFDQMIPVVQNEIQNSKLTLFVTTKGMEERGAADSFCKNFPQNNFVRLLIDPEPQLDDIDEKINHLLAENARPDFVIAYGGGSVIDAGKALALGLGNNQKSPLDLWLRQKVCRNKPKLPLITIPTIAGTGAEVTPFATIWDRKLMCKHSLAGEDLFPNLALECPEITTSLPQKMALYGALDALSHALETHWNKTATPLSSFYANKALDHLLEILPIQKKLTAVARETLQIGALLGGLAISQSHTSIAHAMSYPLTLHFNVPHGLACAAFLPSIFHFIQEKNAWQIAPTLSQIERLRKLFAHLNIFDDLYAYCQKDDIVNCIPEMMQNSRAETFTIDLDQNLLEDIVKTQLEKSYQQYIVYF